MKKWLTKDTVGQQEVDNLVNYWRVVLQLIVDVTITLAINNLPFWAHKISLQGNLLEIIKLLSWYNNVLEEINVKIKSEIKETSFITIITDTTQDLLKLIS